MDFSYLNSSSSCILNGSNREKSFNELYQEERRSNRSDIRNERKDRVTKELSLEEKLKESEKKKKEITRKAKEQLIKTKISNNEKSMSVQEIFLRDRKLKEEFNIKTKKII